MIGEVELDGGNRDIALTQGLFIGIVAFGPVNGTASDPVMLALPWVKSFLDGIFVDPAALAGKKDSPNLFLGPIGYIDIQ